ncbi:MAG: peptidoglycan-binding protein [Oscillospiraceae bacterium]|nr:peptidoglycan-binding protein [Oscillospiraceae bacterium]
MLYTDEQRGDHIEEILGYLYEIALRDSRIPIVLPGRDFTDEAALAVRAFQQAYGLPVTGEIDEKTWDMIVRTYRRFKDLPAPLVLFPMPGFVMQEGDRGALVHLVQVLLNLVSRRYANLPDIPLSGVYDAETEAAVRRMQSIAGLPQTGTLDRAAWDSLASLVNQMPLGI